MKVLINNSHEIIIKTKKIYIYKIALTYSDNPVSNTWFREDTLSWISGFG